jgi:hypothetical protein
MNGDCQDKFRLPAEFQKTTREYSRLVGEMAKSAGVIREEEFELLSRNATQAHENCLEARKVLTEHLAEHRC